MALGKCLDCGNMVSTTADTCPHCGWRVNFTVYTGKTIALRCSSCKGKGIDHDWRDDMNIRFGYHDCSSCKGTGRTRTAESKSLIDGSVYPPPSERMPEFIGYDRYEYFRLSLSGTQCPDCGSKLYHMRIDSHAGGNVSVYRCGRPKWDGSHNFNPCCQDIFSLLPDGSLVRDSSPES